VSLQGKEVLPLVSRHQPLPSATLLSAAREGGGDWPLEVGPKGPFPIVRAVEPPRCRKVEARRVCRARGTEEEGE